MGAVDAAALGPFKKYRVGQKSDIARTYITLYERYHFFGPPGRPTANDKKKVFSILVVISLVGTIPSVRRIVNR